MTALESSQAAASEANWTLGNTASAPHNPPPADRFARYHRGDRNFFLVYVALIWLGSSAGSAPRSSSTSKLPHPRIRPSSTSTLSYSWVGSRC